jgi:hypothetical protein
MEREDHPTGTMPPYPYPPQDGYRPPPAASPVPPEPRTDQGSTDQGGTGQGSTGTTT